MSEYAREKQLQKKREYYRKWRAENPDKVRAANVRYWTKVAEEIRQAQPAAKVPRFCELISEPEGCR